MRRAFYITWLVLVACSGERGTGPQSTSLEVAVEYWPNGYLRSAYQFYVDAQGQRVMHGYYRTYSQRVENLLWSERLFFSGRSTQLSYERCSESTERTANGNFEQGDFTHWRLEGARPTSILLVADGDPQRGAHSAKLTLHPGDIVRGGNRVELVRPDSGSYAEERIYGWSFKIPEDYAEEPYWQALCQFHSQPDFAAGEDWDTYPEHKPPLSILYHQGRCRLIYHDFDQVQHEIGSFPTSKGAWSDVFFQIKWSMEGDGYIEMYADGLPVTPFNGTDYKFYGSNVYNETGNYLKIGLYRDKRAEAINSVYVDDAYIEACR